MNRRVPMVALAAMIGVYVAVFGTLTWKQQSNYGTFGFDMGIHDQGIWLTARFAEPFVTVRGMNYYGHHVNLVSILYVPLYWLGAGPHTLYLTQTISLGVGAVPIWLLARHRLSSATAALVPAAAWLLHPSVEWINWWHWHPEAMAITPLLFAWWFAVRRAWRSFTAAVVLALLCKEDVALAVLMMGVVLLVWRTARSRRAGLLLTTGGAAWFASCTRLIIPAILGTTPFYERNLFPDFGTSLGSVVWGMLTHPADVLSMVLDDGRLGYYAKMLGPFGFIPVLGLPVLIVAAPQTAINALSALPGTYDIRFQYSAMVLVGVALAAVEGIGRLARIHALVARSALALIAVAAVASNIAWSPSPASRDFDSGIWAERIPRHAVFDRAVALIPDDASVSATYYIVPHLTHRREIYEWPNPWTLVNWGLSGEAAPDPATVDYIVLDETLGQERALVERLTSPAGEYEIVLREDAVLLARRRA